MSEYREKQDEERWQAMEDDELSPSTPYEAYLLGLGRPDFQRPFEVPR